MASDYGDFDADSWFGDAVDILSLKETPATSSVTSAHPTAARSHVSSTYPAKNNRRKAERRPVTFKPSRAFSK